MNKFLAHIKECGILTMESVTKRLEPDCAKNATKHTCLDVFRANAGLVRNWRILWNSLTPSLRRESLIQMYAESLRAHRASNKVGAWQHHYFVLGQPVCEQAFRMITGISSSMLTKARSAAMDGHRSSLSRSELGTHMSIRDTGKDAVYLDFRRWLEYYAQTHASQSPITGVFELPSGRKYFYHCQYEGDRLRRQVKPAKLATALECWRTDCPHIQIVKSLSTFMKCGLCNYLKDQIDRTPRDAPELLGALKDTRLANAGCNLHL